MGERVYSFEGLRVLIVDDDDDSREVARIVLENGGAAVTCAASAVEALECFTAAGGYDVVVSDLAMPDRDGLWLVKQMSVRARECGNRLWAIALTGNALPHIRDAAVQAGFDVFLAKPFGS